jgi:hypothetical protein
MASGRPPGNYLDGSVREWKLERHHAERAGLVLLYGEAPEAVCGREDGDAMVAAESVQIGIA